MNLKCVQSNARFMILDFNWMELQIQSRRRVYVKHASNDDIILFYTHTRGIRGRVVKASRFEPTRPSQLGFESHER